MAFAFSLILYRDEIFGGLTYNLIFFVNALIAVGLAFILHELGHKFVAQVKGCWAEFRVWPAGLLIAVAMALLSKGGFVFAAPGAVMIIPAKRTEFGLAFTYLNPRDMGQIGAAGPLVNIFLAAGFGLAAILAPIQLLSIAAQVNAWLAIFNLIPFGLLDGYKIWRWSPWIWGGLMMLAVGIFILVVI